VESVVVFIQPKGHEEQFSAQEPQDKTMKIKADCVLPVLNSWGLIGEIQLWRGKEIELPSPESRLFQNIALQIGLAIERVQITEYEFQHAKQEKVQE
jgi:GAF domain-containing protein